MSSTWMQATVEAAGVIALLLVAFGAIYLAVGFVVTFFEMREDIKIYSDWSVKMRTHVEDRLTGIDGRLDDLEEAVADLEENCCMKPTTLGAERCRPPVPTSEHTEERSGSV